MMKQATRRKLMQTNPAAEVKTIQGRAEKKDTLSLEEIQRLAATPIQNDEIKRAFLFSTVTGLRWVDVSALQWKHINIKERYMTIRQKKSEEKIDSVRINLNDTAIKLLGESGKLDSLVFNLPTLNGANKTVKAWVQRAEIEKKITWHNARHSFGTNLIYFGADVTTASDLLGHTSLKHTQRYVKAAKELKEKATDALNFTL
jgi:site-specific recombinase XerD